MLSNQLHNSHQTEEYSRTQEAHHSRHIGESPPGRQPAHPNAHNAELYPQDKDKQYKVQEIASAASSLAHQGSTASGSGTASLGSRNHWRTAGSPAQKSRNTNTPITYNSVSNNVIGQEGEQAMCIETPNDQDQGLDTDGPIGPWRDCLDGESRQLNQEEIFADLQSIWRQANFDDRLTDSRVENQQLRQPVDHGSFIPVARQHVHSNDNRLSYYPTLQRTVVSFGLHLDQLRVEEQIEVENDVHPPASLPAPQPCKRVRRKNAWQVQGARRLIYYINDDGQKVLIDFRNPDVKNQQFVCGLFEQLSKSRSPPRKLMKRLRQANTREIYALIESSVGRQETVADLFQESVGTIRDNKTAFTCLSEKKMTLSDLDSKYTKNMTALKKWAKSQKNSATECPNSEDAENTEMK